jgi:hypothetical protein
LSRWAQPARALLTEISEAYDEAPDDVDRDATLALAVLAHATTEIDGHLLVIGAERGQTAVGLGLAARATGRGRVFAVDLFPEHDDAPDSAGWSLDALLRRAGSRNLSSWVLPHHGTAATFAQLMPGDFRCRLIHLEGAHACRHIETDVFLLERLLAPGGWLTVSESYSSFPGARAALDVLTRQRPELTNWRLLTPKLLVAQKSR